MQKKLIGFILTLLIMVNCVFGVVPAFAAETGTTDLTITNPYASVDWATYGQYKANFHAHSLESDGANQPAEMFEDHYAKGFDVMALTDHNVTNTTWDRTDTDKTYLTSERLAEMNAGIDRGGRGLIGIPYSNEQSISDHLNTFWADFNNESGATLESKIAQCESLGGISHISHPGRYTGGRNTANNGTVGEAASSQPATVAKYVYLFETYPSCVGMEIINKKDRDSFSDRILWDNILKQTMPERPVWGFSNDDTHNVVNTGFSYNMMLMPENTLENVRYSMENGTFYAVAKICKRELGADFVANGPTPVITNIVVDENEDSITIEGENYNTIEWIANGNIIATGNSIDLNNYEDRISTYVRAQLKGEGGISFTQPFGVKGLEKEAQLTEATLTASSDTLSASSPEGINLTLEVKDNTGSVINLNDAQVEYYTGQDGVLAIAPNGTVTVQNAPNQIAMIQIWAKVTKGTDTVYSNMVPVTVIAEQLGDYVITPIKTGMDDVEEYVSTGDLYSNSSDLELVWEDSSDQQLIGLRFTHLPIPKGAEIVDAFIQFSVDEPNKNADPFNVNIHAEAAANSAVFENALNNVSSRTLSTNSVNWKDIPSWTTTHQAGPDQRTPNLAVVVQEIVDMNGWSKGNAISFILSGTGTRTAESFEGAGSNLDQVPTLYVKYNVNEEPAPVAKVSVEKDLLIMEETQNIEFFFELSQIKDLNALDVTFSFDKNAILFENAELLSTNNGLIKASVTDGSVRIVAGLLEKVTSTEYTDIMKLTFKLADPNAENVTATLHIENVVTASSGVNEEVASDIEEADATVTIKSYKVLCDVDGNGKLGIGDLSKALDYYRADSQDPDWDSTKSADVNMDGVVDIADFTVIMTSITNQR